MMMFVARRIGFLILQAWVLATIIFVLLRLVPGDPARAILGDKASEQQLDIVRQELGLTRPWPEQYIGWTQGLLHGDLGQSVISGRDVASDIMLRIGNTLELAFFATLIAVTIGLLLGSLAAMQPRHRFDYSVSSIAVLGLSIPGFVIGSLLLLVFGVMLGWLPNSSFVAWNQDIGEHLRVLALPVATLAIPFIAIVLRMTRSALLEVRRQDYMTTAKSKGAGPYRVLFGHGLPNALNPVVTVTGVELATLFGNTVVVETIFNWPGISSLLLNGIATRDYPVVQGCILVVAALVIVVNLFVDLLYGVIDPRVRRSE